LEHETQYCSHQCDNCQYREHHADGHDRIGLSSERKAGLSAVRSCLMEERRFQLSVLDKESSVFDGELRTGHKDCGSGGGIPITHEVHEGLLH